jgi:hypothetical protein
MLAYADVPEAKPFSQDSRSRAASVTFPSPSLAAYVSVRQHTSAYVRIRQHTSALRSMRQHTSAYIGSVSIRQHTSAYVGIRQHTSEYVRILQHTSAYVSIRQYTCEPAAEQGGRAQRAAYVCRRMLTYADVC